MDIVLIPASADDYDEYYKIRSCPGDVYWNGYEKAPDKNSFRELFLARLGDSRFEQPEDRRIYLGQLKQREDYGVAVGFVQLIKRADGVAIGCTVVEEYQRHGYATQALKLGVEMATQFDNNVYVQIRDDNVASQGVAKKCGFVRTDEYVVREYPKAGRIKLRKHRLIK